MPGRPTAATGAAGAAEAPASSPGSAADADAEEKNPAVVNPPAVVDPLAVAPAGWVDVTTVGPNLTLKDTRTELEWSNKRPDTNWSAAKDHCNTLNYNGVTGWRLPERDELVAAARGANVIYSAARTNWMTQADMNDNFWSASSSSLYTIYAWIALFRYGNQTTSPLYNYYAVVCVQ